MRKTSAQMCCLCISFILRPGRKYIYNKIIKYNIYAIASNKQKIVITDNNSRLSTQALIRDYTI